MASSTNGMWVWVPKKEATIKPSERLDFEVARTMLHFDSIEDAWNYIVGFPYGSIFFDRSGKLKPAANALLKATKLGLDYDVAAEVYVCRACLSCSTRSQYFTAYHSNCSELVAANEAIIHTKTRNECVSTFDIFPQYATQEQQQLVLEWMNDNLFEFEETGEQAQQDIIILDRVNEEIQTKSITFECCDYGKIEMQKERIYSLTPKGNVKALRVAHKSRTIVMRTQAVRKLIEEVVELCHAFDKKLEFVDVKKNKKVYPRIPLKHMHHNRETALLDDMYPECQSFCDMYQDIAQPIGPVDISHIKPGWSGVILHKQDLPQDYHQHCEGNLFVVMGQCAHGQIQNALKPHCLEDLQFFSAPSDPSARRFMKKYEQMMQHDHEFELANWTDDVWENLACFVHCVCPISNLLCRKCSKKFTTPQHYYTNMTTHKAYAELGNMKDKWMATEMHKWIGIISNEFKSVMLRDPDRHRSAHRTLLLQQQMPLGPLYEITGSIQGSIDFLHNRLNNIQALVQQGTLTEQNQIQAVMNEVKAMKEHEMMQENKLIQDLTRIAKTYNTLLQQAQMPLSLHTMRQLLMDSRMDESYEFDIVRSKGSVANVAPMAFRKYENVYKSPGVYNDAWINLTPTGDLKTDIDYLRIDLPIEHLKSKVHLSTYTPISEETCSVKIGDTTTMACLQIPGCFVPIPHVLRVGSPANPTLIKIQDMIGRDTYVPKQGYCYVLQLVLMLGFIPDQQLTYFVEEVGSVIQELGAWPTFEKYLSQLKNLIIKYPTCIKAPSSLHVVSHDSRTIHVLSTLGLINKHEHYLNLRSVVDLHNLAMTSDLGQIGSYKIGGLLPDLKRILSSGDELVAVLEEKPSWLTHVLLSPVQIWALSQSAVKYQVLEKLLRNNVDIALALTQLCIVSKNLSIYEPVHTVVDNYFKFAKEIDMAAGHLLGDNHEMFQLALQQYAAVRASTDIVHLVDQFSTRKKTIEDLEEFYRKIVPDFMVEYGLLSRSSTRGCGLWVRHFQRKSEIALTHTALQLETCLTQAKQLSWPTLKNGTTIIMNYLLVYPRRLGTYVISTTYNKTMQTTLSIGVKFIKQSFYSACRDITTHAIGIAILFTLLQIIRKCFAALEFLIKNDKNQKEELVMHAKPNIDNWFVKVIAWIALIVGCFDMGLGNDLYFATTKFRTLLAIATTPTNENFVFHAGDEENEIKELVGSRDNFIDFVYNFSETTLNKDMETLLKWYERVNFQGRVLEHPLRAPTKWTLTKDNHADIARAIATTKETEITLIGGVGTGKSTILPGALSAFGPILILVPSRDLVENLVNSIQVVVGKEASMFMMNVSRRGSSNITIMTYGYALMFFSNNRNKLQEYRFVQMDECHEFSEHMIDFYAWWKDNGQHTKLIKTTATPPGTVIKNGFVQTNYPVNVIKIRSISVGDFCRRSIEGHAEGLQSLFPQGGRIIIFAPTRKECDYIKAHLISMPGARVWSIHRTTTSKTGELIEALETDHSRYQIIATTTVLQNGVNLNPDGIVDFGWTFEANYDRDARVLGVKRRAINPGELIQRTGRVGRNKPGTVVQVGERLEHEQKPNAVSVTNSILIAFAMELSPFVSNHMIDEINHVTREQVITAMKFSAPLMFMVHYVRRDGQMLAGYYHLFKGLLLHTADVVLCDTLVGDASTNSFRTLRSYQLGGEIESESVLPNERIPFYTSEFAIPFYLEVARITEAALKQRSFTLKLEAPNVKQAVLRLSTSTSEISKTIAILNARLDLTRQQIQHFEEMKATTSQVHHSPLWNTCFNRGTLKTEKSLRASLLAGNELLSALEVARTETNDNALEKLIVQNPILGDYLVFHGAPEVYLEKIFPTRKSIGTKYIVAIVALGVAVIGLCMMYVRSKHTLIMHGSKKKSLRTRESRLKRATLFETDEDHEDRMAHEWVGREVDIMDEFGAAYTKKYKGKEKPATWDDSKAKWDAREQDHAMAFKTLYELDPTKFKYVVAESADFGYRKRLNRQEKKDISTTILEGIRAKQIERGEHAIPNVESVTLYLFGEPGEPARKVQVTPHNPLIAGRATGKIVGYPTERGKLRQTGKSVEMTELERQRALEDTLVLHAQAQIDFSSLERHIAIISNGQSYTHCAITQNVVVAPFHLSMDSGVNAEYTLYTSVGVFTVKSIKVNKVTHQDLVVFQLPSDFPKLKQLKAMRPPQKSDEVVLLTVKRTVQGLRTQVSGVVQVQPYRDGLWKYMIDSTPGICGGLVMCIKDNFVVGFHSAGIVNGLVGNGAVFTPVTTEIIKMVNEPQVGGVDWKFNADMISWKGISANQDPRNFPFNESIQEFVMHGSHEHNTDKYYGENLTIQGRIIQTFNNRHVITGRDNLFDEYSANVLQPPVDSLTQLPSSLNLEAFYNDFLKYDNPTALGNVDVITLDQAIGNVIQHLTDQGFSKNEFNVEYDFYAILNTLNLDTAMGAMYQSKKKDILPFATPEQLEQWFEDSLTNLYNGKLGIWKASLKAELRPKEKVLANKTRVFTAAPFDVLFGAKAFVDRFNNKFYERQMGSRWTVGINKFNCGWDELANRFNHQWKFIDADGSRYDSSLTPLLFNAVVQIREYFMTMDRDELRIFRNYYTQLVWTPVSTITGQIVKKHKGGPSGQPSTVVDNTLMLMVAVEYARLMAGCKDLIYTCNGDDLLINAPDETCDIVRAQFSNHFSALGLNYQFDQQVDGIGQVEYMSHKWLDCGGILIPKLTKERILSILQWQRSLDLDAQANKLNAAWIESFGYGDLMEYIKEYADWWAPRVGKEQFLTHPDKVAKLYLTDEVTLEMHNEELVFHSATGSNGTVPPTTGTTTTTTPTTGTTTTTTPTTETNTNTTPTTGTTTTTTPPIETTITNSERPPQNLRETNNDSEYDVYLPPSMTSLATSQMATKMAAYRPPDALVSEQACTLEQFDKWVSSAARGYGITPEQFKTELVPYWIFWCIVNSATDRHKTRSTWRKVNMTVSEDGKRVTYNNQQLQTTYEMAPMFREAKPTLRAVMRHFGNIAYNWVKFSLKSGKPIIPHNATKAGLTAIQYYPCCIDFITTDILSDEEINVRNQVINARVGSAPRPLFRHALRAGGEEEDTNLRHPDDANYGRTQMGGAFFGHQPM
nr:polyprotein [Zoysia mosaic virus]